MTILNNTLASKSVFLRSLIVVVSLFVTANPALSQSQNAEKGLAIAKEVKLRDTGWTDTSANVEMILRGPSGDESIRKIRVKTLEVEGDGDKGLTIFDQPRDIAGTAFLSFSKTEGADDQWIYLPALKRVKRISTRTKSSPFMGSEFAYEDMTSFELEKFEFTYLRDETLDGVACFVVEQIPTDKYSGYSKQVVWVDKEHFRMQRTEFYDRKGALLKILQPSEYKLYLGQYWRALRAEMSNQQTGKSTTLLTSDIQFKTGLSASDLDKNALRRLR